MTGAKKKERERKRNPTIILYQLMWCFPASAHAGDKFLVFLLRAVVVEVHSLVGGWSRPMEEGGRLGASWNIKFLYRRGG